jgi:hypothetical protein
MGLHCRLAGLSLFLVVVLTSHACQHPSRAVTQANPGVKTARTALASTIKVKLPAGKSEVGELGMDERFGTPPDFPNYPHKTLARLMSDVETGEANLQCFLACLTNPPSDASFSVVWTNPVIHMTEPAAYDKASYSSTIEVFDSTGTLTDTRGADRIQSVRNWRCDGSSSDYFIIVTTFLDGDRVYRLTPEGKLHKEIEIMPAFSQNEYSICYLRGHSPGVGEAVIPAGFSNLWFETDEGQYLLSDCTLEDGRKVEDLTDGYFLVSFGKNLAEPIEYVQGLDFTRMYPCLKSEYPQQ